MLRFVLRKMISKKWMVLALLIGNILLVSITAGNPMYTQAVLQRTLTKNLEAYLTEKNAYPGLITINTTNSNKLRSTLKTYDDRAAGFAEEYGVPEVESLKYVSMISASAELEVARSDASKVQLSVSTLTGLEEHSTIIAGRLYENTPDENGVVDAIVSERTLMDLNMVIDDVVTMPKVLLPDGSPLRMRVVGVFTNNSAEDIYWVRSPASFRDDFFIHPELFAQYFAYKEELDYHMDAYWYTLLDYTAMRGDRVDEMLKTSQAIQDELNTKVRKSYRDNFTDLLTEYQKTAKKVNVTLWILQVPIFVLLAAFIFMVSRQMLEMEQNEIAVIKSRGAGKFQIFFIYLLQSLIISALAYAAGIPLGSYLCQVIGASNAFLEFVRRGSLPVEISKNALLFAVAASLLSVVAMVIPAVRYSKTSIVGHKRSKNRHSDTPMWQKLGLDIIILAVSLYGLYTFNGQKDILATRVLEGASLDPLLFLSSSLFMIGAGLVAVRVLPLLVWIIFRLFRPLWSPALYASFMRVLRTRSSQGFIMVFLIMTIALGVFNAQAARTINQNAEDNLYYTAGADMVVLEQWESNADQVADDPTQELMYEEPDFGRYENLEGVESIAKVYVNNNITVSVNSGTIKNARLMGIHTKNFGETAWFKDSLSDVHWYHYLNAISQNSRGILVSSNFRKNYGYKLGDTLSYKNSDGDSQRGVIYGFVDYFPGFAPVTYKLGTDGIYKETENYLIVAHLQQLQSGWGITPYQIWMKNKADSAYLYDFAEENGIEYTVFRDAAAQLVEKKNDPVLQGTNGILTVGFIVVLLLCSVGFLIYWILSIQSRSLQFGIFRAMGMSMREVLTMLINEQIFISGLPIATGAVVGHLTAKLYMPLIQLAYAASDNAVPLEVVSQSSDYIRLFVVIGIVILVCMVVLGALISRMKIAQALKLGED